MAHPTALTGVASPAPTAIGATARACDCPVCVPITGRLMPLLPETPVMPAPAPTLAPTSRPGRPPRSVVETGPVSGDASARAAAASAWRPGPIPPSSSWVTLPSDREAFLDEVQRRSFEYFQRCTNVENGLVLDKARAFGPTPIDYCFASVSGTGFGLAALVVATERGWIPRLEAIARVMTTLRFFRDEMEHVRGFFYHFVDMRTGKRFKDVELSSIDTVLFLAGALTAAGYFEDTEIRSMAWYLYQRVDWPWMCNGSRFLCMGWRPEHGFIDSYWDHFCESPILYILALGAPIHPLPPSCWTFRRDWGRYGDRLLVNCPPLFTHQFFQLFLDLRGMADDTLDYFANAREATLANRQFCMDSRPSYPSMGPDFWGLTASMGPNEYQPYGGPPGAMVMDGTIAPAAAGCSIPFTPELSTRVLEFIHRRYGNRAFGPLGFVDAINPDRNWIASQVWAINQGPTLLMIENYRSGLIWRSFMGNPAVQLGMRKAGFRMGPPPPPPVTLAEAPQTNPFLPHTRPTCTAAVLPPETRFDGLGFDSPLWNDAPELVLDRGSVRFFARLRTWAGGRARVACTPSHLYVRVTVEDPEVVNDHPDAEAWRGDGIELSFDPNRNGFRGDEPSDVRFLFTPAPGNTGFRGRDTHGDGEAKGLRWEGRFRAGGYDLRLAIDRAVFGLDAGETDFSLGLHDVDRRGQKVTYAWYVRAPWSTLGRLILPSR